MARTTFSGPVASQNGFIAESDNGKGVSFAAPGSLSASYVITLPPNDGDNGQVLTTDGSGVTTWTTNGVGTVTSVGGTGTISGISLSGTVTASGNLTLGGALDLSSPPAIGGTAAAAGTFTTLTANTIIGTVQGLSVDGAVSLTAPVTAMTTGAVDPLAVTLANGTAGQIKIVTMVVDGGENAVVTVATGLGFTTLTFDTAGDSATLVYTSEGWVVVSNVGVALAA
jgi:hypothetical protein